MDLYDSSGNRVGSVGGGGIDLAGCLTLGIGFIIVSTIIKVATSVWAILRSHDIHPVFILVLFAAIVAAVFFVIAWLLRFAPVRATAATMVAAAGGYGIFYWIMGMSDWIWAAAGLAIFAVFAVRFVKWAYTLEGGLSDVFFL
jgi:hypothetical protein